MNKASKKKRATYAVSTAAATALGVAGMGCFDWRILAGAAAVGLVGGAFGVDVPAAIKGVAKRSTTKKAPSG